MGSFCPFIPGAGLDAVNDRLSKRFFADFRPHFGENTSSRVVSCVGFYAAIFPAKPESKLKCQSVLTFLDGHYGFRPSAVAPISENRDPPEQPVLSFETAFPIV